LPLSYRSSVLSSLRPAQWPEIAQKERRRHLPGTNRPSLATVAGCFRELVGLKLAGSA